MTTEALTLHVWMKNQKVNDEWLAARLEKSRSQANRIRRQGTSDASTAIRLAELTGLPPDTFVRDRAA